MAQVGVAVIGGATVAAGIVAALVVGLVVGWLVAAGRAGAQVAALRSALDARRAGAEEREALLDSVRTELRSELAETSQRALEHATDQLVKVTEARLTGVREAAAADDEARRRALGELLGPLTESLRRYQQQVGELERARSEAHGELRQQVEQLAQSQRQLEQKTHELVSALKASSVRGRWGELQLRRVVELAGMVEHCDFDEQVSLAGSGGARAVRPDLLVHLPGGRQIAVDAKVPMDAFVAASETADEERRRSYLAAHARALRGHVDELAKRGYWQRLERSPELVVCFVPGDALLAAALEQDWRLLDDAIAHGVLLATPTTLVALLRSVAVGWRSERLAEHAEEIRRLGQELHSRLVTFSEHLGKVSRGLTSAVEAYNQAVGSLERRVLPQARRFEELGAVGADHLGEVPQVEVLPRTPVASPPEPLAPGGGEAPAG